MARLRAKRLQDADPRGIVGTSALRVDGLVKAQGLARYTDDIDIPGMLYGCVVTSPYVHAELRDVDTTQARTMPGVRAVLTAADIPGQNQIGVVALDQPLLATDRVRSPAERVALVAADNRVEAKAAAAAVRIDAQELPATFDPISALAADAPRLHAKGNLATHWVTKKGDIDKARRAADTVIERTYRTGLQEHAYLEPNGVIALPEADGSVLIRGSLQCPYYVQKAVARVLGLSQARVRVIQAPTGGGFGGKEDYPSELAACAALLSRATGRPVKLVYERDEDMAWSSKRHATVIKHTLFAKKDGTLLGLKAEIYFDAGPYLGLSGVVAERANASVGGPYVIPHVDVDTYTVYTCNPFGGAFRGFGAPQVAFALESQMDVLAEATGLDPVAVRRKNFLKIGSRTATNDVVRQEPLAQETLDRAADRARFLTQRRAFARRNSAKPDTRRGIGVATISYGCCLHAGGQHLEGSGALVQVHPDASVTVAIGGSELGQGAYTAVAQMAADTLGLPLDHVRVCETDTAAVPDSGPTVASRTTIMSGNAVLDASRRIRRRMIDVAARTIEAPVKAITFARGRVLVRGKPKPLTVAEVIQACYLAKVSLSESGWYAPARKSFDRTTGLGQAYSVYCYATMIAEVSVDTVTGLVKLERMTAVHDVGRAINRAGVEGQIQGGVVQGLGYATMENLVVRDGRILNPNLTDYLIPTALDVPEIDIELIEKPYDQGPYGAKGIGEPSLIPVAPAVANAVADALGLRLYALPLTAERVKMAWEQHTAGQEAL